MWMKVAIMGLGILLNSLGAIAGTWWYLSIAMSGFNTSQNTLSDQMQSLQGSLDSVRQVTDAQLTEARGDLALQIERLAASINGLSNRIGDKLDENSKQVAALNATLTAVDRRLTESIDRQQSFEKLVLQRIVLQGPVLKSGEKERLATEEWVKTGYSGEFVTSPYSEAETLMQWERLNTQQK
jgi:seryl-tRNA synthetase